MPDNTLRYDKMVENALRGVLRDALTLAAEHGLPGDHHFFITFRTGHEDVRIPDHMHARYPDEMTIVIQHQYWGLEVSDEAFEVTLKFNQVGERLHIPFAAVTAFADPSAKFGLQFQVEGEFASEDDPLPGEDEADSDNAEDEDAKGEKGQVIALDAFRKK